MQVLNAFVLASALLFVSGAKPPAEAGHVTPPAAEEDSGSPCFADLMVPKGVEQRHVFGENLWGKKASPTPEFQLLASGSQQQGKMKHATCSEDMFGELTLGNMKEVFSLVSLAEGDKFAELGSDIGSMAVRAAVLSGAQRAESIVSKEGHKSACDGLKTYQYEVSKAAAGPKITSHVLLKQGDLMSANLSDYTVVLANTHCFGKGKLQKLAQKLAKELPEGARVASTQAFRDLPPRLAQSTQAPLKMGSVLVSVYEVEGARPPTGKHSILRMSKNTMKQWESTKKGKMHQAPKKEVTVHRETGKWPTFKGLRHAAAKNKTAEAKK